MAYHCAPTFAGIKAANLLSLEKFLLPEIKSSFDFFNMHFNCKGLYFEILCENKDRILILIYRRKQLWNELCVPPNTAFLKSQGYENWNSFDAVLNKLREKINTNNCFPHEIGMFLSYPLEDVIGFIQYKGKNYKMSGYWKVYGNEQETKKKFEEFTLCRIMFCSQIENGMSIFQILEAA